MSIKDNPFLYALCILNKIDYNFIHNNCNTPLILACANKIENDAMKILMWNTSNGLPTACRENIK